MNKHIFRQAWLRYNFTPEFSFKAGRQELGQVSLSFLFLNNGVPEASETGPGGELRNQGISFSQPFGPFISYSGGESNLIVAGYYQGGKDASEKPLSAWYANLEASFVPVYDINVQSGYEFLSGTHFNETEKNHSFTPFYGTNHKFNGFMDYFYTGDHLNNVGLHDIYIKAKKEINLFTMSADLHGFLSAPAIEEEVSDYLGTDVDLVFELNLDENVTIGAGYSQMFAGESMGILKGGSASEPANWAWLMVTVTPTFFTSGPAGSR